MTEIETQNLLDCAARSDAIRAELRHALNNRPVTAETIAGSLRRVSPKLSERNLRSLLDGAAAGRKEFLRLSELPETRRLGILPDAVEKRLSGLEPGRRRQSLLLLLQILSADSGLTVDGVYSVYFSNLPEEDLKRHLLSLMKYKGRELIGKAIPFLSGRMEEARNAGRTGETRDTERGDFTEAERGDFTEAEQDAILTAAIYAAQSGDDREFRTPDFFGRNIGMEHSFIERMAAVVRKRRVSDTFALLDFAESVAAVRLALDAPLLSDAATLFMGFAGKDCMLKLLLTTAFPLALSVADGSPDLFRPLTRYAVENGERAVAEMERYFTEIRRQISETSVYAETEMEVEEEDSPFPIDIEEDSASPVDIEEDSTFPANIDEERETFFPPLLS